MGNEVNHDLETAKAAVREHTDVMYEAFKGRQKAMELIAGAKDGEDGIFQPQKELEILVEFREKAEKDGLDPDLVDFLVWGLMSAGKMRQQDIMGKESVFSEKPEDPDVLKQNLLELTAVVAARYDGYSEHSKKICTHSFATERVMGREDEIIQEMLSGFPHSERAIDLGCGTGKETEMLSHRFREVVGYDVSPDMLEIAKTKHSKKNMRFEVADLEKGIPEESESVDLVISSFSSASAIKEVVFSEMQRILRPGGKAFLSFYNKNALIEKWWKPWTNTLNMMVNPKNDTLYVPIMKEDGTPKVYTIKAGLISWEEIQAECENNRLSIDKVAASSHLWDDRPNVFFRFAKAVEQVIEHEQATEDQPPFLGQYIRVIVSKT